MATRPIEQAATDELESFREDIEYVIETLEKYEIGPERYSHGPSLRDMVRGRGEVSDEEEIKFSEATARIDDAVNESTHRFKAILRIELSDQYFGQNTNNKTIK